MTIFLDNNSAYSPVMSKALRLLDEGRISTEECDKILISDKEFRSSIDGTDGSDTDRIPWGIIKVTILSV
jgi:hypothetical protein